METYSAVPSIVRLPIRIVDFEKYDEWLQSDPLVEEEMPTITKVYIGYKNGAGCPVPIALEVAGIQEEYRQTRPTEEDAKTLEAFQYIEKWRRVNMLLRRNLLLAVIRDMDPDNANYLATEDDGPGFQILVKLDYLQAKPTNTDTETPTEDETEGEVEKVGETG